MAEVRSSLVFMSYDRGKGKRASVLGCWNTFVKGHVGS